MVERIHQRLKHEYTTDTELMCSVCNGVGASLPSECPGRPMTEEELTLVTVGMLDYKNDWWWNRQPYTFNSSDPTVSFIQNRVDGLLREHLSAAIIDDIIELNHRLITSVFEFLQTCGYSLYDIFRKAIDVYEN